MKKIFNKTAIRKILLSGISALGLLGVGGCLEKTKEETKTEHTDAATTIVTISPYNYVRTATRDATTLPPPAPIPFDPPLDSDAIPIVEDPVSYCAQKNHDPAKAVRYTSGEVQLIRSIFGEKFEVSHVKKYFVGRKRGYSASGHGCSDTAIEFHGTSVYSPDYSREKDAGSVRIFIHEILHSWQAQSKTPVVQCREYFYRLNADSNFNDFCNEQQASMAADYVVRFIHPSRMRATRLINANTEGYELLKKVVEEQFPEAKKTRLAIEAREKAAKAVNKL